MKYNKWQEFIKKQEQKIMTTKLFLNAIESNDTKVVKSLIEVGTKLK